MKLSGHSYNNDVFNSLLDGVSKDVVLMKKEASNQNNSVKLAFTQTTQDTFDAIAEEEATFIANELLFAAKNANVEISGEDLSQFASEVKAQGLRGKALERAARKHCSKISRIASMNGVTRTASAEDLIQFARNSTIVPAGFPSDQIGDSKTGGYMGMSKNPNTIWNSEALTAMAVKPNDLGKQYGDEQIQASKQAQKDFADKQKLEFWQDKQNTLSDPNMLHSSVAGVHTSEKSSFNPNLPSNSMSMFSEDRDFNNIPSTTTGESIAINKKEKSASPADTTIKPAAKADNSGSFLFEDKNCAFENRTSSQRSATDRLFEGILKGTQK